MNTFFKETQLNSELLTSVFRQRWRSDNIESLAANINSRRSCATSPLHFLLAAIFFIASFLRNYERHHSGSSP